MDLSKLPKLSKTAEAQAPQGEPQAPEAAAHPPVPAVPLPARTSPIGLAEAWISIGLGALLLFIYPNTISFMRSPAAFQQNNPVTDPNNNPIPYVQSIFFWSDLGITVFAGALIVEGIVLALARKIVPVVFAFALTVAATLFNVIVIIHAQPIMGFPVMCGVGVVVLGYMALTQWRIIAAMRQ